ncbi:MAG: hypothetical protein HY043_22805 [Verrucomicrobia bacterium]|nr:hypothetical protein [Verrucomicrobiota bacterium]
MKRHELERALRAAARVARESEFFLIGSQAAHACCRRPPAEVLLSQECDLYPKNRPETATLLDARLGRGSRFAREHGFYVDVVTPDIANLAPSWEKRLIPFRVGAITALCLEIHDLIVSKLAAGRLKDLEFVGALLRLELADRVTIRRRIGTFLRARDRNQCRSRLKSILQELSG